MENRHIYILLTIIFILSCIFNSFILFVKPLSEDSYFSLRYVEHIKENFLPIFNDDLSYGGRAVEEPFLFYYILALFSLIHISLVKIIPILLTASLVLIVFLISTNFTNKRLSLIPAILAGFIPAMFGINLFSPTILAFAILLLLLYSSNKLESPLHLYLFLVLSFILPLTSFLSIFYIFAILIYMLIVSIEKKRLTGLEREALIFSLFVNIFIMLFIFRTSLLAYGPSFILQNTPSSILADFFKEFTLIKTIGKIGIGALVLGAIGFVFSFREKSSIFIASYLITCLVFLWLKLVPFKIGLILFSLTLAILSSLSLKFFNSYINQTKFSKYKEKIIFWIIIITILLSIVPSGFAVINFQSKVNNNTFNALKALSENNQNKVILAPYEYGHAISYLGNKNVADDLFLLAPLPEKRVKDIDLVYTSQSKSLVLEVMKRYLVDYIIFDEYISEKYQVKKPQYLEDKKYFSKIYDEDEVEIYRIRSTG